MCCAALATTAPSRTGTSASTCPGTASAPKRLSQWIDLSSWINGETGGYLRVCTEGRNWFETDFPNWLAKRPPASTPTYKRSEEHGSYIIEALETGRTYRGHFNVINQGHITNLPDGCVVEIPGYVDRTGINMPVVGDLPLACAATCSASVRVQEMGVEAAVHGDVTLLKQAMLHDPLVGAVCNPEEVWQMTDEMLVAQAQWLPKLRTNVGAIESLDEARLCADLFKKHRDEIDGVLVTLPNFGDERAIANTLRWADLDVPVLIHAFPDDARQNGHSDRRDSFCGKMSPATTCGSTASSTPDLAAHDGPTSPSSWPTCKSSRHLPGGAGDAHARCGHDGRAAGGLQHGALQRETARARRHQRGDARPVRGVWAHRTAGR
jgi:hypothetical protein